MHLTTHHLPHLPDADTDVIVFFAAGGSTLGAWDGERWIDCTGMPLDQEDASGQNTVTAWAEFPDSPSAADPWRELFWQLAQALNCLPSTFTDGNAHVLRKATAYVSTARTYSDVIANHCIAMQAAVIEAHIGKGPDAAMAWIRNTLRGPGLLPDLEQAQALGGAQAWFDAKTAEHEAARGSA